MAKDLGARYASYWTKEENENKALDITKIPETRKERQKNYAEIAKE